MTKKPTIYLDTNIIRDCMRDRRHNSIVWVEKIREYQWNCVTSIFAFMEILDIEQDDLFVSRKREEGIEYSTICRRRNERDMSQSDLQLIEGRFVNVFVKYPFIKPVSLSNDGWDLALHIVSSSNIFSPDAIHLASAWQANCDLILTEDEPFIKHAKKLLQTEKVWNKMRICQPDQAKKMLTELEFTVP